MNSVEKAIKEGRLKFYSNGSYSYKPSQEYLTKVKKIPINTVVRDSIKKLDNLLYAFGVAEKQGKKVSHVSDGKIILV